VEPSPIVTRPFPEVTPAKGSMFLQIMRTTDHKLIGRMYMVTSFVFFAIGGLMALVMRAELAQPGMQFLSLEQYNQLFTMHGTAMLLFFGTPIVFAFANLVLPLQIGSPDVAFPRLNALSYWLFLFGAVLAMTGFVTPGGAADFGWTVYTPLSDAAHSPQVGADLWIIGLGVGAAIANSNNGYEVPPPYGATGWREHVAWCEGRYRSYNPSTDTFIGYDGRTYRCVSP